MAVLTTLTVNDKRGKKSITTNMASVYTRVVDILIPASTEEAAMTLPRLKFEPGSYCLGVIARPLLASTRAITSFGSTTFALSNGVGDLVEAATVTAEKAMTLHADSPAAFLTAGDHTGDESFTLTTAAAHTPANDMILELTFIVAPFGSVIGRTAPVGN